MHSNMVMIQLIKRRNSSTFISSISDDRACTKSDSKNDRQRKRDTANSLKNVASKNQKEFMVDLKTVYQAASKDSAEYNLLQLDEKWGKKYLNPMKT